MTDEFRYERRVEFCETDAAGLAHFSAYFQYMEQAEHALLRHLGTSVIANDEAGTISWPRVSATCDYAGPVKFEDVLEIGVRIARLGTTSITYRFDLRLREQTIATGQLTAVCCRIAPDQSVQSIPIPSWLIERLRPFVLSSETETS